MRALNLVAALFLLSPMVALASEVTTCEPVVSEALGTQTNYECAAGPSVGQACTTSADCALYCTGGPDLGQGCATGADCQKVCSNGPSAGADCTFNSDCTKFCLGGPTPGKSCTQHSECGGAGGQCVSATCSGFGCARPACANPYG